MGEKEGKNKTRFYGREMKEKTMHREEDTGQGRHRKERHCRKRRCRNTERETEGKRAVETSGKTDGETQ
jgi:hypothetical protein